jgi:N-acetylglucosaminyl-diphospho-decaprenol L-rhamnosyltransferase
LQLSVIIVNYNVKHFLEQCLFSVIKASANIECEIFVVDNHSTDGSREYLLPKFPGIHFNWNNENLGFAKANNSVLDKAKGNYILFLNPDTIVAEDTFIKCIHFLENNKEYGALGVRMIDGSGTFLKESKRSIPYPATALFKMSGLAKLFPSSKTFAKYYAPHIKENNSSAVDVLAGAFMMLSAKAVKKIKGFDEDFFMYGEDIDLSYRVKKAGLKNYYFAGTTIIHFKGESTSKHSAGYHRHFYDSMKLFISKHFSDKRFTVFAMNAAVNLAKFFVSFKNKNSQPVNTGAQSTIVVSSHSHFNELIHLLKHAERPVKLSGRVAVNESDTGSSVGTLDSLKEIIASHKAGQVIFCEGDISFKDIIMYCQLLKKTYFLFHAKGSTSIVGSNNKDENGIFISMPPAP